MTFDLSKFRLKDSLDVVAGLDSRPVLMDLTPTEFEVTTSWFGRASEAFAGEHGRLELLDGANLVYLFKEHLGLDVVPGPYRPSAARR